MEIGHLAHLLIRQKVMQRHATRVPRIQGTELQSRFTGNAGARHLHGKFLSQADQLLIDFDDFHARGGKVEARGQTRTEQFVYQDAPVLRVILELDHVIVAVRTAHQMRLRAAAHPAYLLQCVQHRAIS